MKYHHQNLSQRMAFAGLFVLLLPILSPHLFSPLSRSYPSLFSVRSAFYSQHFSYLSVPVLICKFVAFAGVECTKTQAFASTESCFRSPYCKCMPPFFFFLKIGQEIPSLQFSTISFNHFLFLYFVSLLDKRMSCGLLCLTKDGSLALNPPRFTVSINCLAKIINQICCQLN
jgi:hypothetical protein